MLAEILSAFELSMLYSSLRFLIEDFGNPAAVGWIITSFLLASAAAAAICGRLGDMFGRRRVLLIVIAASVVGSLISGFSTTLAGVIAGRVIQGAAGAIFPLCIGLIRENVRKESVPIYIGVLAATMNISGGIGAVLGGVLVDNLSWHWIFFCGAAVGALAFAAVQFWIPAARATSAPARTNVLGVLFAPAVVCLLLGVTKSADWGWLDSKTLLFFAAAIVLMAAWAVTELRAESPLINIRLLASRQVLLINLMGGIMGLSVFQFLQVLSLLLQQPTATGIGLGLSATMTGFMLMPMTLMALVGGPAAGWMVAKHGGRVTAGLGTAVLGLAWLAVLLKNDSIPVFIGIMTFMGLGQALLFASLSILIAQSVPMERTSEASGVLIVIRVTFMGIGAQVVASLLNSNTVTIAAGQGSFPSPAAYFLALAYVVAGCAVMFLLSLMLSSNRKAA